MRRERARHSGPGQNNLAGASKGDRPTVIGGTGPLGDMGTTRPLPPKQPREPEDIAWKIPYRPIAGDSCCADTIVQNTAGSPATPSIVVVSLLIETAAEVYASVRNPVNS